MKVFGYLFRQNPIKYSSLLQEIKHQKKTLQLQNIQLRQFIMTSQEQQKEFQHHTPSDWANAVDWSKLPAPVDDGTAAHLQGSTVPEGIGLQATNGQTVDLAKLKGLTVVFAYPRSGTPLIPLEDWDNIPGARGCTPHSCSFRDRKLEFEELGVQHLFGLSTQDTDFQRELVENALLPFLILSDQKLALSAALKLPTMVVAGQTMIKRLALVLKDGHIVKVFYPVFPPDRNAQDVLEWLRQNSGGNK